jgi:CDP-paratose 2-epimerase
VDDLLNAFLLAQSCMDSIAGEAFNIGGGPSRTTSLIELVEMINELESRPMAVTYDAWREADQRYYVTDTGKFRDATGWVPDVSVAEGIRGLHQWLVESRLDARQVPATASR